MNCHSVRSVLDLHAEGRLTARRGTKVTAHLETCAECRALAPQPAAAVKTPGAGFKAKLAAALKKEAASAPEPEFSLRLDLWPRDLGGVALAAAGLAVIAVVIGWSGVPSQRDMAGEEIAAGRIP